MIIPMLESLVMKEFAEHINHGGIGVVPTDTVYGLIASAKNQTATLRLYNLKKRENKPGTIIASSIEQLIELGLPSTEIIRATKYWPGQVSVVISASPQLDYLTQSKGDIAVRLVANIKLREILDQTGPLISSSANDPGKPTATTIQDAEKYFGSRVDFYIDGGDLSGRLASTIIRINDDESVEVLRQGAVTIF